MSIAIDERQVGNQALGVRVVKPFQFDNHTPQTPGMLRLAAVSHALVGSEMLWAGVMLVDPGTASSVHHPVLWRPWCTWFPGRASAVGKPAGARSRFRAG